MRKIIYQTIENALLPILDENQQPVINHVSLWNNQLLYAEEEQPFNTPAVFIEFRDIPWNKAFVVKSVQHQRDIVPVHFEGQNSNRFYNVARWCKRLHLPNFAMALLPDEMYRCKGKHFVVRFGKPIPWQTFDKTRTPAQWGRWVQDKVYEI